MPLPARSRRGWLFFGGAATVAVVIGVGLGVGLHHGSSNKANTKVAVQAASGSSAAPAPSTTASVAASVASKPLWNWTDTSTKLYGMSVGNHLLLERWQDEDWFVSTSNEAANDEWTWTIAAGSNANSAITEHWQTWFTADDVAKVAQAGFNTLRIPTGFWMWIPTEGDEPYVQSGQIPILDNLVEAAYNNNLYVLLSLHGMPGNQDGTQTAGHNTSDIEFYTPAQQTRADATLAAALAYMTNSPYRSIFSGIGICNEPVTYTSDQLNTLTEFYERSYSTISSMSSPIPMIFSHAGKGINYWTSFVEGKNPNILVIEDKSLIILCIQTAYCAAYNIHIRAIFHFKRTLRTFCSRQVCSGAQTVVNFPVPVAITEWSLTTGVVTDQFMSQFFQAQFVSWFAGAGSVFWNWKTVVATNPVYSNTTIQITYSFSDLLSQNIVSGPSSGQAALQYAQTLPNSCGVTL